MGEPGKAGPEAVVTSEAEATAEAKVEMVTTINSQLGKWIEAFPEEFVVRDVSVLKREFWLPYITKNERVEEILAILRKYHLGAHVSGSRYVFHTSRVSYEIAVYDIEINSYDCVAVKDVIKELDIMCDNNNKPHVYVMRMDPVVYKFILDLYEQYPEPVSLSWLLPYLKKDLVRKYLNEARFEDFDSNAKRILIEAIDILANDAKMPWHRVLKTLWCIARKDDDVFTFIVAAIVNNYYDETYGEFDYSWLDYKIARKLFKYYMPLCK